MSLELSSIPTISKVNENKQNQITLRIFLLQIHVQSQRKNLQPNYLCTIIFGEQNKRKKLVAIS